jgi:hypothetical protein
MTKTYNFDRFEDTNLLNHFSGTLVRFDDQHSLRPHNTSYVEACMTQPVAKIRNYTMGDFIDSVRDSVCVKKKSIGMFLGVDDYVALIKPFQSHEPRKISMFMNLKFLIGNQVAVWTYADSTLRYTLEDLPLHKQTDFDYREWSSAQKAWWNTGPNNSDPYSTESFIKYLDRIGFIISKVSEE